jgi:glutathione S-transferase
MSALVALHEKNLSFDIEPVDISSQQTKSVDFSGISLTQRVPALKHDTFYLSESSAIAEYLDETFTDKPLYPKQPQNRAVARQLQAWLRSDLMPIRFERPTEVLFYGIKKPALSSEGQHAAENLFCAAQKLISADQQNLFEEWCIADVDLALMLNRLILNGDNVPENLANYAKHQWKRASVQLWLNLKRPAL